MARKTMWAVVGALLAFAPAASAATYGLTVEGALTYAKEMKDFGVDYDDEGPKLRVELYLSNTESAAIGDGDFMDVTISLSGATFAENVKDSDMSFAGTALNTCTLRLKDTVGGDRNTSSVTFQVETTAACGAAAGNAFFIFELPPLTAGGPDAVTATVVTATPGGNSWPDTSSMGVVTNSVCTTPAANCTQLLNGQLRLIGAPVAALGGAGRPVPLVSFADALTHTVAAGGAGTAIDFEGGRTDFTGTSGAHLANVSVGVTQAAMCTGDDVERANAFGGTTNGIPFGCVRQSDGKEFRISRNGEGRGEMFIAVFGDFREDDMVFLDIDGDGSAGRGESFTLEEDGSMAGVFDILDLSGNAAAAAGDAGAIDREEGVKGNTPLRYHANGEDPLRPTEFRVAAEVVFEVQEDVADPEDRFDFNDWRADGPPASVRHTTSYTTIESTQHSYSIPDLNSEEGDLGNLRIKCEVSTPCTVYLECDGGAGGYWFGELDNEIEGRATVRLSAADIADVLNAEDGWMNGLQCAVHSTRTITVQSLTRAGGVLVNHTYIARD